MMMTMMMGRNGRLISVAEQHAYARGFECRLRNLGKWTNEVVYSDGICKLPLLCLSTC